MQPLVPSPPPLPGGPPGGATAAATEFDDGELLQPPTRERKAVASLALGVVCLVGTACGMGLSLGLPAIVLGALAHRDIRRSGIAARGSGMATAGIILGTVGSTLFIAWIGLVATTMLFNQTSASGPPRAPSHGGAVVTLGTPSITTSMDGDRTATPVIELHRAGGPLRTQLANRARAAARAGEVVLVQTATNGCDACADIASALPGPAVTDALAKVRLVRIDVAEFHRELAGLRMNEPSVPWFYLLDARGQPLDAISADEWDDNVAENIAPILAAFVHGSLEPRRSPWRGRTSL